MLGAIGAGGGGVLAGALGQATDALSMPRRALWGALGLPDSGAQLVGNVTGMDPDSVLAQILGGGAEMLGDPLTLAGAAAGGPLTKLAASPWLKEARLMGAAGDLRAGIGGADAALAARQAVEAQTLAREVEAAQGLAQYDIPGMAAGAQREFPLAHPGVGQDLLNRGTGFPTPSSGPAGGAVVYGNETPPGFVPNMQMRGPGGRMVGSGIDFADPAAGPLFSGPRQMTAQDRDFLQAFGGQTLGGPLAMNDQETRAALQALGQHVGGGVNAARPMPTLGQAATENPLLDQLLGPRAAGLPMQAPLTDARSQMAQTLASTNQQLQRYKMNPADWGMVGGAGLTGLGLGGYLGGHS